MNHLLAIFGGHEILTKERDGWRLRRRGCKKDQLELRSEQRVVIFVADLFGEQFDRDASEMECRVRRFIDRLLQKSYTLTVPLFSPPQLQWGRE
jgi:hypothetical protein